MNIGIRFRTTSETEETRRTMERIAEGLTQEKLQPILDDVALETWGDVVERTPKGWTGNLRRAWTIEIPGPGRVDIVNPMPVARFIEEGTANGGTGRIYPRRKRALFIPLTATAAVGGWTSALRFGVDYILRKWVKGIRPRWIARDATTRAEVRLIGRVQQHLERLING